MTALGLAMRSDDLHVDPARARKLAPLSPLVLVSIPKHTGRGGVARRHEVVWVGDVSLNYGDGPNDRYWQARCSMRGIGEVEDAPRSEVSCPPCQKRAARGAGPRKGPAR